MDTKPTNAPEACPGTNSESAGKGDACAGCPNQKLCSTTPKNYVDPDIELINDNLQDVKNRILILSGKGGVGKSTVTSQLARSFAADEDVHIGVMDVDICGPSQAQMMGVDGSILHESASGLEPVICGENDNISVVSVAFLLESGEEAVIWRGDKKQTLIKQFLRDVNWESLDTLFVDTPPGTSDEHLALCQLLSPITGAILVTTPQEVAWQDVRKEINFCKKTKIPILGLIINMTHFTCPTCSLCNSVFIDNQNEIKAYARENNIPILGCIPLNAHLAKSCDNGENFIDSEYKSIAENIKKLINKK